MGAQSPVRRSSEQVDPHRSVGDCPTGSLPSFQHLRQGSEQVAPVVDQEDLGNHSFTTCEVKGVSPN